MRISDIQIDRYGICQDISFGNVNSPILVVYGPNEAGKTTTMEFIRNTMFGSNPTDERSHIAVPKKEGGGEIRAYDHEGNHWLISRTFGEQSNLEISINGQLHPNSSLVRDLLGGVGPEVFRNVFTVGIGELQRLNQLNATEAANFLYDMTTGYDRVSLGSVLRGITEGRELILDANECGVLAETLDHLGKTESELTRYRKRITEWSSNINSLRTKRNTIADLKAQQSEIRQRQQTIEASLEIHDLVSELKGIEKYLSAHQHVTTLSEKPAFRGLQDIAQYGTEAQHAHLEVLRLEEELLEATVTRKTLSGLLAPQDLRLRLQAFTEMLPWVKSLRRELMELGEQATHDPLQSFTAPTTGKSDDSINVSLLNHKLLKELRLPARELKRSQDRVQDATLEVDKFTAKCIEAEQHWIEDPAWNQITVIPNLERPSFCLADDLREQHRKIKELENQTRSYDKDNTEFHLTPDLNQPDFSTLVLSATVFSIGGTMLGMGLFFPTSFGLSTGAAIFCGVIGLLAISGGIIAQILDQKQVTRRKQRSARNIELARIRQNDQVSGLSSAPKDYNDVIKELEKARELLDLLINLNKQASAIERLRISRHTATERLTLAKESAAQAQCDWERRLASHGISEQLTPAELYSAVEHADDLQTKHRLHLDQKSKLRRTRIEFAELELRLTSLLTEFDDKYANCSIDGKLELLEELGQVQEDTRSELAKTEGLISGISERIKLQDDAVATANRSLISELSKFGVASLHEMEKIFNLAEDCHGNRERQAEIYSLIQSASLKHKCDGAVIAQLAEQPISELELQWDSNELTLENVEVELAELNQAIGGLKAESAHISAPGDLNRLRLQAAALKCEQSVLETNWKVWATSELISGRVRDKYESQRQPETLRDASQWLEEITGGTYVRVWTPLGEDVLFVDDDRGQSWSIDSLSRGTRESIFLSLRLALVRSYRNEGVSLPLILDDVLVNCDLERAKNAISALHRFADEVGQVLFFTCHEHIAKALETAQADVRKIERPEKVVAPQLLRLANTGIQLTTMTLQTKVQTTSEILEEVGNTVNSISQRLTANSSPNRVPGNDEFGDEIEIEIISDDLTERDTTETAEQQLDSPDSNQDATSVDVLEKQDTDHESNTYADDDSADEPDWDEEGQAA